jgi:predicted membrane channel-forming protein YqfA (hemolysin III family)
VNIWIHLVGALGFALAVPYAGTLLGPGTSGTDLACFVTFLCAATLCLGVSGLYHALANHSEEMLRAEGGRV